MLDVRAHTDTRMLGRLRLCWHRSCRAERIRITMQCNKCLCQLITSGVNRVYVTHLHIILTGIIKMRPEKQNKDKPNKTRKWKGIPDLQRHSGFQSIFTVFINSIGELKHKCFSELPSLTRCLTAHLSGTHWIKQLVKIFLLRLPCAKKTFWAPKCIFATVNKYDWKVNAVIIADPLSKINANHLIQHIHLCTPKVSWISVSNFTLREERIGERRR